MSKPQQHAWRVGIVGVGGRGGSFIPPLQKLGAKIAALCDSDIAKASSRLSDAPAAQVFSDYDQMLAHAELDAVVIGTPMPAHAAQSIAALQRGLHVLCEVPAAVSIDECRQITLAAAQSRRLFMMAENYPFLRSNMMVAQLIRQGEFGTPYYAEGEYLHEAKEYAHKTPWRRHWQLGIDGVTYITHSLAPLLGWLGQTRLTRVSCAAAGSRHCDEQGHPFHQASPVMLGKTASGALVKIRIDLVSDRPHALTNYSLQATNGAYESSRGAPDDHDRLWLRTLSSELRWSNVNDLLSDDSFSTKYLPPVWRDPTLNLAESGHGGSDMIVAHRFLQVLDTPDAYSDLLHEAMDATLPGLVSQLSIANDSQWMDVPDSRQWLTPSRPQLQMVFPSDQLDNPPSPAIADDYQLRLATDADIEGVNHVLACSGLARWDYGHYLQVKRFILPGGHFVIVHRPTARIVATAMAQHQPQPLHPFGGEVGWVAADPAHAGSGLGAAIVAASVRRLAQADYHRIYLQTDDQRLPAIAVYLRLGFEPLMCDPQMPDRWNAVREQLDAAKRKKSTADAV